MKQRGITELHVEHVLQNPDYIRNSFDGRKESSGRIYDRTIRIEFAIEENYIKIITVM